MEYDSLLDVLLLTERARLTDALEASLDLESGLRAILPPGRSGAAWGRRDLTPRFATAATAEWLRSLPPTDRVRLRAHPTVIGLTLVLQLDAIAALCRNLVVSPKRDVALAIGRSLSAPRDLVLDLGFDSALHREITNQLDHALGHARDVAGRLALGSIAHFGLPWPTHELLIDIIHVRARLLRLLRKDIERRLPDADHPVARALLADLARDRDLDSAADRSRALAQAYVEFQSNPASVLLLGDLTTARNDFVAADLSRVNLRKIPLLGVRWSRLTRWPSGWEEMIEHRSLEIEPGLFEIQNDGMAQIDRALASSGL